MEYLYVWVESYGTIQEQGFNFGGPYHFEMVEVEGNRKLLYKKNTGHIEGFFDKLYTVTGGKSEAVQPRAKVQNVTAIVGENGAGKTTLLRYLQRLSRGLEGWRGEELIVFRNGDRNYLYYHKNFPLLLDEKLKRDFMVRQIDPENLTRDITEAQAASYIHFSNVFDLHEEEESDNLYNISTNNLIMKDKVRMVERHRLLNPEASEVSMHRLAEVDRQLTFLNDQDLLSNPPFALPHYLYLSPITFKKANQFGDYDRLVRSLVELIRERKISREYKEISWEQLLDSLKVNQKVALYESVVLNFFYEVSNMYSRHDTNSVNSALVELGFQDISTAAIILMGGEDVFERVRRLFAEIAKWVIPAKHILAVLEFVEKSIPAKYFTNEAFRLSINDSESPHVGEFFNNYRNSFYVNPYLELNWEGLSSGQTAFLNLLSRFYSLTRSKSLLPQNLVILIDEGELYFHPQWQKKLLDDLLTYLPEFFAQNDRNKPQRNIQIIMTSNSPFIASDLPNSNVIFLKNDRMNNRTMVVTELENQKQTFAANIHTLYTDSFFMEDGLIGEFAKGKINELVHFILHADKDEIRLHEKRLDQMIRMIGEPVVKNKLLSLLQERTTVWLVNTGDRFETLEGDVGRLQRELEEMKEELKRQIKAELKKELEQELRENPGDDSTEE